ncbi:MAG TPA: hypothetical protein VE988_02925 [Gemmataceae bacterium]|nr:hypothetical protein [Gemmataceae bacterium]
MLTKLSEFRWHVFSKGYKCEDCTLRRGEKARVVVPKWWNNDPSEAEKLEEAEVTLTEGDLNEVFPLDEEPGLYRKFAGLDLIEEAILRFADRWGPLENAHEVEPDEYENTMVAFVGDTTQEWFTQIRRMRALVELWDVLQGKTKRKLADLIDTVISECNWSWDVEIRFKEYPDLNWHQTFRERDWPGFSALESGRTREVARTCLFDLVNESLWGSCSPWLSPNDSDDAVTVCLTPHNLKAAMWLMFAQELTGEKDLKQCLYCKGYFEASTDTKDRRQRSDKKYCSPKCRGAAFRERGGNVATKNNDLGAEG